MVNFQICLYLSKKISYSSLLLVNTIVISIVVYLTNLVFSNNNNKELTIGPTVLYQYIFNYLFCIYKTINKW